MPVQTKDQLISCVLLGRLPFPEPAKVLSSADLCFSMDQGKSVFPELGPKEAMP